MLSWTGRGCSQNAGAREDGELGIGSGGPLSRPLLAGAAEVARLRAEWLSGAGPDSEIADLASEGFDYTVVSNLDHPGVDSSSSSDDEEGEGDEGNGSAGGGGKKRRRRPPRPRGVTLHRAVRALAAEWCPLRLALYGEITLGNCPLPAVQLAHARLLREWAVRAESDAAERCTALLVEMQEQRRAISCARAAAAACWDGEGGWSIVEAAAAAKRARVGSGAASSGDDDLTLSQVSTATSPNEEAQAAARRLELLSYAAAVCVARWGDLRVLAVQAVRDEAALLAQLPAARAAAEAQRDRLAEKLEKEGDNLRAVETEVEEDDDDESEDEEDW